ncbi:MAG: putative selenium-dependent hydroxylase accessory protein YqeC [Oscillospiraceae bacterium]|nr:putative selenium-dependent hydroxylase accessory protein YqeC [Oscillospiraceae bacterium]
MELCELLGVRPGVTAFIGGGGKTSMMYTLARELTSRGTVICATTTRIFPPSHLPVLERVDRETLERARCVCAGTPALEGKLAAPAQSMAELAVLADYVLVEADGSRGLPVKAHQSHEPVIPAEAGLTVVLVGASAFGRPVREVVHRMETFCRLTGLSQEAAVTPEAAAALLRAEALGDVVFVNQAETAPAAARQLAEILGQKVFAGSLRRGEWICLS